MTVLLLETGVAGYQEVVCLPYLNYVYSARFAMTGGEFDRMNEDV